MDLAWTIWACLIFIFLAIMVLGMLFDKKWLACTGIVGLILEGAALFILIIIGKYIEISNGNI